MGRSALDLRNFVYFGDPVCGSGVRGCNFLEEATEVLPGSPRFSSLGFRSTLGGLAKNIGTSAKSSPKMEL